MDNLKEHLSTYHGRIKSFNETWPFQNPKGSLSSHEMAKAGFYFLKNDCVKCYYCEKELEGWLEEDNAYEEHKKHASYCPFVKMFADPPDTVTVHQAIELEKNRLLLQVERSYDKWLAEFKDASEVAIAKIMKEANKHKRH